jgi:hypothetical protein
MRFNEFGVTQAPAPSGGLSPTVLGAGAGFLLIGGVKGALIGGVLGNVLMKPSAPGQPVVPPSQQAQELTAQAAALVQKYGPDAVQSVLNAIGGVAGTVPTSPGATVTAAPGSNPLAGFGGFSLATPLLLGGAAVAAWFLWRRGRKS